MNQNQTQAIIVITVGIIPIIVLPLILRAIELYEDGKLSSGQAA